ncbi:hypothetical protein ELQ92_00610 [Labedella populi]|uniref:Uncharacterized protein n=1 Tax=Labedella populi TaxID=2498850 RepID=A0A444QE46_9MICO|nr:hypothetical protein [Labedella populi]RWZ67810.1 hypothetical protein ELQ92_00610 [Labedella populi]
MVFGDSVLHSWKCRVNAAATSSMVAPAEALLRYRARRKFVEESSETVCPPMSGSADASTVRYFVEFTARILKTGGVGCESVPGLLDIIMASCRPQVSESTPGRGPQHVVEEMCVLVNKVGI